MQNGQPPIDIDKMRREECRWRILCVLNFGRPYTVTEQTIWRAVTDMKLPFSENEIRRELDYLEKAELITTERGPVWAASLTAKGMNVAEYTEPAPPGITRPDKWW